MGASRSSGAPLRAAIASASRYAAAARASSCEVVLEQTPERHMQLDGPILVALGLGEPREGGGVAFDLPRSSRQIEHAGEGLGRGRRARERAEAGFERVRGAAQVLFVERGQLLLDLGGRGGGRARRELRLEGAREEVVALPPAQRRDQAAALAFALARLLEGRLELLGRAGRLAAETRDLRQLEEHLGAARLVGRRLLVAARPAHHREQGPVGARGPLELALLEREPRQRVEDLRVRRVDAQRRVQLADRLGALALGQRHLRQLEVHDRPLLGAPPAVGREHRAERRRRMVEIPHRAARGGEAEVDARVVGAELRGLLQERGGGGGVAVPEQMDLRGLAEARDARGAVRRLARVLGEELRERPPLPGLPVERRQPLAQRRARPLTLRRALEPRPRGPRSARGLERLHEAEHRPGGRLRRSLRPTCTRSQMRSSTSAAAA